MTLSWVFGQKIACSHWSCLKRAGAGKIGFADLCACVVALVVSGISLPASAGQKIYVLVNDEPISAYDVRQRVNFMLLGANEVTKRMRRELRSPNIQDQFRKFAIKHKPQSQDEVKALQKKFVTQMRRNAERSVRPAIRSRAVRELINERLKLQEAKRLNILIGEDDLKTYMEGLAKQNKQTLGQFRKKLGGQGVNISTLEQRMKSQMAWRNVIRRRYGRQVSIGQKEIDQILAVSGGQGGGEEIELLLHRITLPLSGRIDQSVMAARFADADRLRRNFRSCESTGDLAKSVDGARFQNLGRKRVSTLPQEAQPIVIAAESGQMAPPVFTSAGIHLYAVCGRRTVAGDSKKRAAARQKLEQEQYGSLAKRLLRDLCNDAFIEFRSGKPISRRCGEG